MAETKDDGPLSERVVHKNWKIRLAAYEELEKIFKITEESDPKYNEYAPVWKAVVGDSNAAAQDKGTDALVSYLSGAKDAAKLAPLLAPIIVEKCLVGRVNTKQKGTEALLIFIEAENAEPVVTSLVKTSSSHKVPKVRSASLEALREVVKQFGPKPLQVKIILSSLASFFDHPEKAVREEASALCIELFRWLGPVVRTQIDSLRPAQIKELEAAFEEIKGQKPTPLRFTRSQQLKNLEAPLVSAQAVATGGSIVAVPEQEDIDPFDLVEPVNVLAKIGGEWLENINSPKWQIRKEQLETLVNAASVPRIQPGDFGEILKALKKLLGDANVIVVSKAAQALGLLARGLRKDFAAAKSAFPVLLDKLKEKKNQVVEAIHTCLDFMYDGCFTLIEVMEDIQATSEHKVPKVRQEVLLWLTRCFQKSTQLSKRQAISKVVKPLANYLVQCLDDGNPDVRDASSVTFGALAGVVGERPLNPYLNQLDKIKLQKVKENFPQVLPVAVPTSVPEETKKKEETIPPKAKEKAPKPKDSEKGASKEEKAPPKAKVEPKKPSVTKAKPAPTKPSNTSGGKGSKASAAPKKKGGEIKGESPSMSTDDALNKAKEIIPENIIAMLVHSNWKERLNGIKELSDFVQNMGDTLNSSAEVIVQQLNYKPGWKESNFQVCNSMFILIGVMAKSCVPFPKYASSLVIAGIIEKIADAKIKSAACDCLTSLVEAHNSQFVFSHLYKHTSKHKNPKVIVETLTWIAATIEAFGMVSIQAKQLIDYMKESLESTNPTIKTQAIKTLGVIRQFVGASLRDFIVADIKPALLNAIDEEFARVADTPPPSVTRYSREVESTKGVSSSGNSDILPREDISGKISPALIKNFSDNNWKVRKEAIEEVQEIIISANKRIESNLGGLLPALKARLADSNKNLVVSTLELLALLAVAVGPSIEKHMKVIVPPIFSNFSDTKKNIRDSTAQSLDSWVTEVTFEPFISYTSTAMSAVPSSDGRKDLLTWVVKHLTALKQPVKSDLNPLVKPALVYIEDKSSEVRHLAETLIKEIAQYIGGEAIKRQCNELKPASKLAIAPLLESLKEAKSTKIKLQSEKAQSQNTSSKQTKEKAAVKGAKNSPSKTEKSKVAALILRTNQKEQRAKKNKPKLTLEELRQDTLDILEDQFSACIDPSLHTKMFSTDFKHHVEALAELSSGLVQYKEEIIDCLDLLLRWCAFRLADTNVSILKNVLEFLESLLTMLSEEQYQLTEHESGAFLSILVEKMGNNNETIRLSMRSILNNVTNCYPASKVFSYVMEGIKSKNSRSRTESLEELGNLVDRHGVAIANVQKALPILGECIADNNVRVAALNTILVFFHQMKDDFWKYLGNLPETSKLAIQEKLKYQPSDPTPTTKSDNIPGIKSATKKLDSSDKESPFKLDVDKIDLPSVTPIEFPYLEPTTAAIPATYSSGPSSGNLMTHTELLLANITTSDPARMIESLKMLCLNEDDSVFILHSDKLATELANQLNIAFHAEPVELRIYKYLLNTLHKMFTRPAVAKSLSAAALANLTRELIEGMSDPKLGSLQDGQHLSRALNLLMISLLENAEKTAAFSVLFQFLRQCVDSRSPNPKFLELVMKSLLKLTKSLHADIDNINLDLVLRDIHSFLEAHPPSKWTAANDQMPLRTTKTILNEIVALKGSTITNHLTLVPLSNPPPVIVSYINLMLETQNSNFKPSQEIKSILTEIFKKIGVKETTQEGLYNLYQFQKTHANVDIQPHLQRTSEHFQEYIKRGLLSIEQQYSENRDPNSASTSDQFAVSYMDRLRKLQSQYGLKTNDEISSSDNSISIDVLRMSINRIKSNSDSQGQYPDVFAEEVNTLGSSRREDHSGGTETTVEELRQRLARIKNAM